MVANKSININKFQTQTAKYMYKIEVQWKASVKAEKSNLNWLTILVLFVRTFGLD